MLPCLKNFNYTLNQWLFYIQYEVILYKKLPKFSYSKIFFVTFYTTLQNIFSKIIFGLLGILSVRAVIIVATFGHKYLNFINILYIQFDFRLSTEFVSFTNIIMYPSPNMLLGWKTKKFFAFFCINKGCKLFLELHSSFF